MTNRPATCLKITDLAPKFDIGKLVAPGTALNFYSVKGKNLHLAIPRSSGASSKFEIFAYNEKGVVGIYGRLHCQIK